MQSDPLAPYQQMTPDEIKQQDKQIAAIAAAITAEKAKTKLKR